jgi:folylpolyglutamate synthase/dihydropteroate synthase
VLLDAAPNPDSMRWLGRQLAETGVRYPVIFGCQRSRDPREMLAEIAGSIDVLVPIAVPVLHPCPVSRIIAAALQLGIAVSLPENFIVADVPADLPLDNVTELDAPDDSTGWIECVQYGLELGREQGLSTVICGSIYYLGEILRAFEDGWVPPPAAA